MAQVDDRMNEIGSIDRAKENHIDNHMIASAILGVDTTEVYSPERVNGVARRYGRTAELSPKLTNVRDFAKPEN